jgi:DNA-binding HxlR family transcriptional regulator
MTDSFLSHYPGLEGVEYCPVAIGANVMGDRWSLLIVRELLVGATRFNEIHRALPGLSRSMLSGRLRSLERHGLLERLPDGQGGGYRLTEAGADLRDVLMALGAWTVRWRFPPPTAAVPDSPLLLWRMYQGIDIGRLPPHRVTVEFAFDDAEPSRGWLLLDGDASTLCMEPPGDVPDLVVTGSVRAWLAVWFGHCTYTEAVEGGDLKVQGAAHLVAQLPSWFHLSALAHLVAEHHAPSDPAGRRT